VDNGLIAWIQHTLVPFVHSLGPAAVADLIAAGSLMVAALAYKNARRATDIARISHDEHGRLKSARIHFIGKSVSTTPDGRKWIEDIPIVDNPDYLKAATILSVYGGPDPLNVDQVVVVIEYIQGVGFARSYTVIIPLKSSYDQLLIDGPRLPKKLEPYHRLDWILPFLAIIPFRSQPAPMKPGLLFLPPYDYMSIKLIATPAGHTPTSGGVSFGKQFGLVTRHHHFNSLDKAISASVVPEGLKTLLSIWVRSASET
jgi:hypothetical protein